MAKTFPYLEVSGTYKDISTAIGTRFKEKIQKVIEKRRQAIPDYASYLEKTKPYFETTQKYFPQLIEELEATQKQQKFLPRISSF